MVEKFEVTKVTKRKDKRYITVEFESNGEFGLDQDDYNSPLNVRVFHYRDSDGVLSSDPTWGKTELAFPLEEDRTTAKLVLEGVPDNIVTYEVGVVREGLRWVYTAWVED